VLDFETKNVATPKLINSGLVYQY